MKCLFYILAIRLILLQSMFAQQPAVTKIKLIGYHNQVTAGPAFPIGLFGETHFPGISSSYTRITRRIKMNEPAGQKKTGWIMAASLSHYTGRKENTGSGSFRYSGYSLLDLQGGLAWYPKEKLSFSLRTGPGLGNYKKIIRFIFTGQLQGSYKISAKTTIIPGFSFIKEPGSDALWISSLQLGYFF